MLLIYEYIVNYLAINIELHTLQIHWLRHLYLLNIKIMIICIEKNIHFERLFIYFIFRIYKIPFHKKWASLSWVVDPILLTVFLLFTGYYYLWIWIQTRWTSEQRVSCKVTICDTSNYSTMYNVQCTFQHKSSIFLLANLEQKIIT